MKKKKKHGRRWLLVLPVLAALAAGSLFVFRDRLPAQLRDRLQGANTEVQTYTGATAAVERGTILRTTEGSGAIEAADRTTVAADYSLKLEEVFVEDGDRVAEGDLLATLDADSIQDEIDARKEGISELNSSIRSLDKSGSERLTAPVGGRVKRIFIKEGDLLPDVVERYGGVMELDPTGKLKVQIADSGRAEAGDRVTVAFQSCEEDGIVTTVENGLCTVEFDDDSRYQVDVEAEVKDEDGKVLGSGSIKTSYPYLVDGAYGTCREIRVDVNDKVDSGSTLLTRRNYTYNADYKDLLKQREDLQEEVQELNRLLADPRILSVGDGILSELALKDRGEITGDAAMYTLISTERFWLKAQIDELDIAGVEPGQRATVVFDAWPDEETEGVVEKVSALGQNEGGVATYTVTISVPGSGELKTAMSATATIEIERREDVLLIPVDALQTEDGRRVVTLVEEGGTRQQEVVPGLVNNTMAEIQEGLSEGQTVAVRTSSTWEDLMRLGAGSRGGRE